MDYVGVRKVSDDGRITGEARIELAAMVLRSAGEISAADLTAAIGGRRKEATAALNELAAEGIARARDAGEYLLWTAV